jgi:iron complex transport system substrate-binding protein
LLIILGYFIGVEPAQSQPQRIVSLNICTDQLLLLLAERQRIASVTWLSADPEESPIAKQAAGLPLNHGQAEEIIPLHPDLIIAGTYTARFTVDLLKRRGYRIELIEPALSLQQLRSSVLQVAELVGAKQRGEQLLVNFDKALSALAPAEDDQTEQNWPSALIYAGKGFAAGVVSLENDLLKAAGLRNHADEYGLGYSGYIDLESLLSNPPDILVISRYHIASASLATRFLQHPALRNSLIGQIRVELPGHLSSCTPNALLEAVQRLHQARLRILDSHS